jgi:hypothetical protein
VNESAKSVKDVVMEYLDTVDRIVFISARSYLSDNISASTAASLHLFKKVAVPGICEMNNK